MMNQVSRTLMPRLPSTKRVSDIARLIGRWIETGHGARCGTYRKGVYRRTPGKGADCSVQNRELGDPAVWHMPKDQESIRPARGQDGLAGMKCQIVNPVDMPAELARPTSGRSSAGEVPEDGLVPSRCAR